MKGRQGLPSFPGSKLTYVNISIFTLLEALAIIAQAIFLARAVTFLFQGQELSDVSLYLGLFLVSFMLRYLFSLIQQFLAERFAEKIGRTLRKDLLMSYFSQGQGFVQRQGTGKLVTLALEGIDQVKSYIELAIPKVIRSLIVPLLIVIYIFTLDKSSAFIVIAAIPIVIIFMILLGLAAQMMADRQYESYRILSNHFIDSLKGIETLAYLGRSREHGKRISEVSRDYRRATNKTLRYAFLSSFALDFFTSLAIAFVAVGLGFRLIDGVLPLLPALTILILAPEYFLPIRQVGQDYHASLDGQVALKEIEGILQEEKEVKPLAITLAKKPSTNLELEDVSVRRGESRILSKIKLKIQGPKLIGIVGPSGAGKSTFIHLLAGLLHPAEGSGSIKVNGEKTNTLDQPDWLAKIAYIPQHPYIFPSSLLDNIRFYEPDTSEERVMEIVEKIGLGPLIKELPKGIHQQIGEGGRSLSGGQEQRIALARALLSQRPILLLDEPTAHLDIETEYELKEVTKKVFANKLVFFATHRVHWMNDMDHLLVLEKGRVVEEGSPAELRKQSKLFTSFLQEIRRGGEPG